MRPGAQILLLVVLAVAGIGVAAEFLVFQELQMQTDARIRQETTRARSIYDELQGVEAGKKIAEVRSRCLTPQLLDALTLEDPSERHFAVFKEAHVLAQARVKADILIVLDNDGIAIARNIDAKYQGVDLSSEPMVKQALGGEDGVGVWFFNGEHQLVSVVPIEQENRLIGALVVGNALGKQTAKDNTELLGGDFFLLDKSRVLASTMSGPDSKALLAYMESNREAMARVFESSEDGAKLEPVRVKLPSGIHWAVFSDFNQAVGGERIGYAIVNSVTRAASSLQETRNHFFLVLGVALFALLGWGVLIARTGRRPIEALFIGAQEILHGNRDYQWDQEAAGDLGAVGGTLNAMVAILLGKELPDEHEYNEAWEESLLIAEPLASDVSAPADTGEGEPEAVPAAEDAGLDADYYHSLFEKYVEARKECGLSTAGISEEKFVAKIKGNEELLCKKHSCKGIRFTVAVSGGKPALQAHPIK